MPWSFILKFSMGQIHDKIGKLKKGTEVLLTTPRPGEGAELIKCVNEIMLHAEHLLTTAHEFKLTAEQEDEMLREHFEHRDKIVIVPKVGGRIVGMMNFKAGNRKRNSHQGEFGMSVHPKFQGQGIGRLLLDALLQWAGKNPRIETVRLKVLAKNQSAYKLYLSCGFKEEGREVNGVKLANGVYDDIICMARSVR